VHDAIVPIESFSEPPQGPGTPIADEPGLEVEGWFLRNRDANAFNWVRLNTGSGIHRVEVVADYTQTGAATPPGFSAAQAVVGNRMLIVETTHMSNDILVSNPGSS
jgi:hypothetical protein